MITLAALLAGVSGFWAKIQTALIIGLAALAIFGGTVVVAYWEGRSDQKLADLGKVVAVQQQDAAATERLNEAVVAAAVANAKTEDANDAVAQTLEGPFSDGASVVFSADWVRELDSLK